MAYYTRGYYSGNTHGPVYEGYRGGFLHIGPYNEFKYAVINFVVMASSNKTFAGIRTALATSISLILPKRVNRFTRVANALATNLAKDIRVAFHKRLAVAISVSLASTKKSRFTNVRVMFTNLARVTKLSRFNRKGVATVSNLANVRTKATFTRVARAMVINLAFEGKISVFHRYATARMTVLTTNTKHATFIRVARVMATNVANDIRLALHKRLSSVVAVQFAATKKNRSTNIRVITTNSVKLTKLSRFKRISAATANNLIVANKKASKIRVAKVVATIIIKDTQVAIHKRLSSVIAISLVRVKKARSTNIKIVAINLIKIGKISKLIRKSTATTIRLITTSSQRRVTKKAYALQSVSATVTRTRGLNRKAQVTTTYAIGTTKGITYFKKAIATTVGLVRYGLSLVMNVRSVETAKVEPVNEVNFYVTPNNPDVVGEYTSENDQPGDYSEPVNNLGEDVVPT
jgi:hypothetical protein